MRPAPPELIALLDSGEFVHADLYEISLRSGQVIRMTSADIDLTVDGLTYTHALIKGGRLRLVRGLEVDEGEFAWTPGQGQAVNGVPMRDAVLRGLMDRAMVARRRAFMPDWASPPAGSLMLFLGEVADAQLAGPSITLQVNSLLALLNANIPAQVYQASCRHLFGSAACGVDVAALTIESAVGAGSGKAVLLCDIDSPAHYWQHGRVLITSGANAGVSRSVKSSSPGRLDLTGPFPFLPAEGDTFTLYPGCDKTLTENGAATGCGRYNNRTRYGGYPWVPVPETGT